MQLSKYYTQKDKEIQKEVDWKQRLQSVLQAVAFSVVPIALFYLMEFYEHIPWKEVRSQAQLFNMLLFELIAWGLFFVIGRASIALQIVTVCSMLFGLVNHYVMKFRSTPFVPWDIYSVKTAMSVADEYDFSPEGQVIIVTILFLLIIIALFFWKFRLEMRFRYRVIAVLAVFICLIQFVRCLQNEEFQSRNYLYPFLFTPGYMTKVNGMAVTFAMDLAYVKVDRPSGYRKEEAQMLLEAYQTKEEETTAVNQKDRNYPNIIVIMDEAFSDLSVLGNLPVNEDYMTFVHQLQKGAENTITGNLHVSVCGGNTANSEFEFLTGHTMAFLPTGSIPYQQYIKKETPSLASYLKELGYATYAQHPYYASGWEREKVYPYLGFEETSFLDDYESPQYLRKYVSDESSFSHVIDTYQKKEAGKPAFIFNVTMQNHGGYSEEYSNFTSDIMVFGSENASLNQYLSLIKRTDQEFEKLISYFAKEEEKTIVIFFGDHQPNDAIAAPVLSLNGKSTKNLSKEEQELRYQVPYVVWANFDIDEKRNYDVSLNYLAADVLQWAGVPTSDYQNFLLELQAKIPVISAVKNDNPKDKEVQNYQKMQYYCLFDQGEK